MTELGSIVQAAEEGDALASAVLRDLAEEEGLDAFWKPRRGDWVLLLTGLFYYCGQLLGEDHECYCLAPGNAIIYDTGEMPNFLAKNDASVAAYCGKINVVRKGPVCNVIDWNEFRSIPTVGGKPLIPQK